MIPKMKDTDSSSFLQQ